MNRKRKDRIRKEKKRKEKNLLYNTSLALDVFDKMLVSFLILLIPYLFLGYVLFNALDFLWI